VTSEVSNGAVKILSNSIIVSRWIQRISASVHSLSALLPSLDELEKASAV